MNRGVFIQFRRMLWHSCESWRLAVKPSLPECILTCDMVSISEYAAMHFKAAKMFPVETTSWLFIGEVAMPHNPIWSSKRMRLNGIYVRAP